MAKGSRLLRGAVVLTAVLSLSACAGGTDSGGPAVSGVTMHDDDGLNGALLPKPYVVPDVTLTDTSGKPYRLASDTTKPITLVFFGYTHCPDICQVVMADLASAVVRLDDGDRAKVGMLFVTSDPARDTAPVLREYLDRFDPSFEGLTGDLPTITKAADALGVPIEKGERLPSGGYEVTHGTQVVGVRPDGTADVVWTEGTPAGAIAEDLHALLGEG